LNGGSDDHVAAEKNFGRDTVAQRRGQLLVATRRLDGFGRNILAADVQVDASGSICMGYERFA
jgi:hypothetical protein